MGVFRVEKNKNYTVMSNYHLRDRSLSMRAKGLLSVMLSLPEDWDYSINGLAAISVEGVKAIRSILAELEDKQYLIRQRYQKQNGQFDYDYYIYEEPHRDSQAPHTLEGHTVKGHALDDIQLNTKELNTKELNNNNKILTEDKKERKVNSQTSYDDIINENVYSEEVKAALYEFIKMRKLIKKPLTDYALKRLIKKLLKLSEGDIEKAIKILDTSTMNNWQDIYELKVEKPAANNYRSNANNGNVFLDIAKEEGIF